MKNLNCKKLILLLIIIIKCLFSVSQVYALEERKIYIGDIVNLKIDTIDYTEEDIKEMFRDFEVVHLQKKNDGYIIAIRTFEVGKKVVKLGDKDLEIIVHSTSEDNVESVLVDGESSYENIGINKIYIFVLYTVLICFLVMVALYSITIVRRKNEREITPCEKFLYLLRKTNLKCEDSLGFMKCLFKTYMEDVYSYNMEGKTSRDVVREIEDDERLREHAEKIEKWFDKCDSYIFSNFKATIEEKEELFNDLEELVKNMKYIEEEEEI